MNTVSRFDVRQVGKAVKNDAGFLKVPVSATRIGVFKYIKSDGSTFSELRLPEEVFSQESMDSLKGVPFTKRHPTEMVSAKNAKKYMVGFTSDTVENDGEHLNTSVTVTDAEMIGLIESKVMREVSCGYVCEMEMKPGVWKGEKYDAIQRKIRYNHLAAVEKGRAGPKVRLHMDSDGAVYNDSELDIELEDNSHSRGGTMAKIKLGGAEYEVDGGLATAIGTALKDSETKGRADAEQESKTKIDSAAVEAKKLVDASQAKIDELTEANKKLEAAKTDSAEINKLVVARVALIEKSKPLVKADTKFDEMDELAIKKAVITAKYPELKLDEKSAEYVAARFDAIIDAEPVKKSTDDLKKAVSGKMDNEQKETPKTAEEVREAKMKADSESWKQPIGKHSKTSSSDV